MPRAKSIIHRPAAMRASDTFQNDAALRDYMERLQGLDDRLKEIVNHYRIMRWRYDEGQTRDSVRETLKQLAKKPKITLREWAHLDEATKVEIRRATKQISCPDNFSEAAKKALLTMPKNKAGRKRIAASALFARDLALYWYQTDGRIPTAYYSEASPPSPFQSFAEPLFELAGFKSEPKQLHAGIMAAQQAGKIPNK